MWTRQRAARCALIILGLNCVFSVSAQSAYVNDQLEITLRSGESTQHSIVRMLGSGTPLTVLNTNPASGYTHVRLEDGRDGYVLSRYLSDQPIARDRLRRAEQTLAELTSRNASVNEEVSELRRARSGAKAQVSDLTQRNEALTQELAQIRSTAADALNIDAQNKRLNLKLTETENEVARLQLANEQLAARSAQWWFVLGAAAVLLGALLGFMLPRMRWRRRSSWGDL